MTTDPNFDRMLDAIIEARQNTQRWEQLTHLIAQALYDLSKQPNFQPTQQFHDAVLAYNRTIRHKYRTIKTNRPKDLPETNQ